MAEEVTSSYSRIIEQKIRLLQIDVNQLVSSGQTDLAVRRVGRGLAIQPRNPLLYQLRGEAYAVSKDYPSAIQNIKKALSLTDSSNAAELKARLAILYDCYGEAARTDKSVDYQLALSNFRKANESTPENPKYRLKCIQCLFAMKRNKECLTMVEYEMVNGPHPTVELLITRAKLYLLFGRVTDCYHDVEAVLGMEGDNPIAQQLMKDLQIQSLVAKTQAISNSFVGKDKEAIRKLNVAISTDPHNPYYHIFRGAAYRKLLLYSVAVDDFLLAMDKCSHQYDSEVYQQASRQLLLTYNEFAMHCFRFGCYGDAVVLLNRAIKEEKNEYGLYQNRGDCYFEQKEYEFALCDYNQALILHKRCVPLDYKLCLTHYTIGLKAFDDRKMSQSIDHFTNAIKYSPYTARLYMCRARTKYELKDILGAKEDTLRSLLLDTNCEDTLPLVARLFPGNTPTQLAINDQSKRLKVSLINDSSNNQSLDNRRSTIDSDQKQQSTVVNRYISEIIHTLHQSDMDNNDNINDDDESVVTVTNNSIHDDTLIDAHLSPRSWVVLDIPRIILLSNISAASSSYQIRGENNLHSFIYYTKKTIKEEIRNFLQSNITFPPQTKLLPLQK